MCALYEGCIVNMMQSRKMITIMHVGLLRTSSVRISFCQDTTCIFNSLAGGRVAIVTMHSLRRLIHWTVTCFYCETDYRKFVALLLDYFSARVHRTLIRVYIRFTSNETSINLVSFIILIHFITHKEKRVDKSTQHVHRHSLVIG